jgi:hypothetical protein
MKRHEERVALGVDLLAVMCGERLSEQPLLVGQELAVPLATEPFEQRGRPFNVRK